jgi:hypothetical protein
VAGRHGEMIHPFEHKVFRPRSSHICKGVEELYHISHEVRDRKITISPTVIYVPPIRGSDTLVWNAEIPTNWTVLCEQWDKCQSQKTPTYDVKEARTVWRMRNAKNVLEIGGEGNQ